MTDASLPVKAFNAYDHLSHHAPLAAIHAASHHQQRFHAPKVADVHEDDGQISCICGFQDDDGWTVACDACNKWQHQSCYYPQFDEIQLPDDLAHYCVDCQPRAIDSQSARRRQLGKRDQSEPLTNGAKRLAPTNRKKKTKENGAPQTNGWPVDKLRHDRNSASPRDQGPPAKRPKTSHRASDSTATSTTTKGHSRKRNTSTALHRRSLSRSPDSPVEQYSENFLQCYMEDDWAVTDTNLHNSIGITNALSEWLNLPDDEFRSKHSQTKGEVLMRWDGDLNDIPGKAEVDIEDQRDDSITYNGSHPCWKRVTVREPVPTGAYIGELKGHICFKKDYQDESANRWAELRHPEPFVFFHPKLPIVVDARNEGTELRYVRRSCYPNARLQILVTDSVDYHFCFMATQQIEPGEEVAVGWDTNDGLPELALRTKVSDEDMELLTSWVSTALANCGPCACNMAEGECMMSRFDRRVKGLVDDAQVMKVPKSKKRKNGQHISPLNTNALNSRSGSEARKVEPDDDRSDSRSVSGSAGRGSASRDITPNTHYSTNGTIPEMSERERKKLAKEEEMFRRQEEEKAGKQAKKKRNSGGSSLNTPSATSSKQLGFPATAPAKYGDGGLSRQGSHSSAKALANKKAKKMQARPAGKVNKRPKPVYVDADTQCDMDEEQAEPPPPRPVARKPTKTLRQRLLERCAKNNHAILSSAPPTPASTPDDRMDVDTSKSEQKSQASSPQTADRPPSSHSATAKQPDTSADADTEMHDAIDDKDGSNTNGHPEPASTMSTDATKQISPSDNPPPPPWAPKTASTGTDASTTTSKPSNMHLQMPPPTTNPFAPPAPPLSSGSNAPGSVVQSPASMGAGPVFSPSVTAAVNPSPARKKLSLSDYTRRKAKKEDAEAKADRESSPASTASGPIVPPLQASSSSEMKAAEGTAIEEDVKMEEAENVPPTAVEPRAA